MPEGTEVSTMAAGALSPAAQAYLKAHDLPPEGVNILGGKPYINASGLLYKAKKLGIKAIRVEIVKSATKADLSAIVKATVEMKDGGVFEDFGYGSADSIQMRTLHSADNITMTTITRAKNRALRAATGVGLVSAEEVKDAHELYAEGGGPSLALPAPSAEAAATPITEGTRSLLVGHLDRLKKDTAKMLAHYSKLYQRELSSVLDLTEAEALEVVSYLAGVASPQAEPPAQEPPPVEAPKTQADQPTVEQAFDIGPKVEVMPPKEKPKSKARQQMEAGMGGEKV